MSIRHTCVKCGQLVLPWSACRYCAYEASERKANND